MDITFAKPSYPSAGALVTLAAEESGLTTTGTKLDRKTRGALTRAMKTEKFTGKSGQFLAILAPTGLRADRVILVGVGKGKAFDSVSAEKLGGLVTGKLKSLGASNAALAIEAIPGSALGISDIAAHMAYGASLRGYRF
ncbi:uncharacterized protein METZ01_LOCUS446086, partial [marine metagenome]